MYVVLIVPSGTELLHRVVDNACATITEKWGGCSAFNGWGFYKNPYPHLTSFAAHVTEAERLREQTTTEPIVAIGVDTGNTVLDDVEMWFDNLAVGIRDEAKQQMVYYRIEMTTTGRYVGSNTIVRPCQNVETL